MKRIILLCCGLVVITTLQCQIIHVPGDFPKIQQGINAANPGDTVLVSDGIYYEQIDFLGKKPLIVASEFIMDGNSGHIDNTVIDGNHLNSQMDSASMVYFISGEDSTSILCGFTIRHGKGTDYYYDGMIRRQGGGILTSLSGAKIIHNHITDNHVNSLQPANTQSVGGGGIGSSDLYDDHWVVISDNVIDLNSCVCSGTWSCGGGVQTHGNARISNNTITNNTCTSIGTSASIGGGFNCANMDASEPLMAVVEHNVIIDNVCTAINSYAASPGGDFEFMKGVLSDNLIENNSATTNSTDDYYTSAAVTFIHPGSYSEAKNNTFRANTNNMWSGGLAVLGWFADDLQTLLVENNYFLNNDARVGGAFAAFSNPVKLQNNVFSSNRASEYGGAIYCDNQMGMDLGHMVVLINNSFFGNKADDYGGGIYSSLNGLIRPLLMNCVMWGDSSILNDEIYMKYPSDTLEITNSDINPDLIYGVYLDTIRMINEDPLLIDQLNLIAQPWSPLVDAGIASFQCSHGETYYAPSYDILGNPRPYGAGVDMGAHDTIWLEGIRHFEAGNSTVFPNPFANSTTFRYRLDQQCKVSLKIYNNMGCLVAEPACAIETPGKHEINWNAENLPSGVYGYRLQTGKQTETGKMILVK